MMRIGQKAPGFKALDQDGNLVTHRDFAGKVVVLYFYPKDDTPGCTVEACSFRDSDAKLKKAGAVVLGVSVDDEKSHTKFIRKFSLPFPLLADTDKKIVNAYQVWGKKQFLGRSYMGTLRTTFVIDKKGIIRHIFEKVKPIGHADEVLAAVKTLSP